MFPGCLPLAAEFMLTAAAVVPESLGPGEQGSRPLSAVVTARSADGFGFSWG